MLGQRIETLLRLRKISQSKLARLVGLSQSTINGIISGEQQSTTKLHEIARALSTTTAYLKGEVDDPDADAPPIGPPTPIHVMLPVALPSERALAQMFEGLLLSMDLTRPVDEQARLLAQRLPIGLSQLRDLLPDRPFEGATPRPSPAEAAGVLATPDREQRS